MACPKCGCKTTYQYNGAEFGPDDERVARCAACGEILDTEDSADEEEDALCGDGAAAAVTVLHPAPEPHHAECAAGCSGALKWMAGPCRQQCAKTPEFQEQCARDAEASSVRFRTTVGANVLRDVPATGSSKA